MDFLIHHMLATSAHRLPHKQASIQGHQQFTYSEVERTANALAYGLQAAGLKRGERIGILLQPSLAQALSIFAASKASLVFVPINHLLFPEQVAHIMRDCGMKALITTRSKLSSLAGVISSVHSLSFILASGEEDCPTVKLPILSFESLAARAA